MTLRLSQPLCDDNIGRLRAPSEMMDLAGGYRRRIEVMAAWADYLEVASSALVRLGESWINQKEFRAPR